MDAIIEEIRSITALMVVSRAAIDSMPDSELAVSLYTMHSDIIKRLGALEDSIVKSE